MRESLITIQRGSYRAEGFIQLVSCLVYLTHAEARNHMDKYQMKNKNRYIWQLHCDSNMKKQCIKKYEDT